MKAKKTKYITNDTLVAMDRAVMIWETAPTQTYGVWRAPVVRDGQISDEKWCTWLETNGDPVAMPDPTDKEAFAAWLADAGITKENSAPTRGGKEWEWFDNGKLRA